MRGKAVVVNAVGPAALFTLSYCAAINNNKRAGIDGLSGAEPVLAYGVKVVKSFKFVAYREYAFDECDWIIVTTYVKLTLLSWKLHERHVI